MLPLLGLLVTQPAVTNPHQSAGPPAAVMLLVTHLMTDLMTEAVACTCQGRSFSIMSIGKRSIALLPHSLRSTDWDCD